MENKFLTEINQRSRYGPDVSPIIIRQDEAGNPNDPQSSFAVTWERSPSPLNLYSQTRENIPDRPNLLRGPIPDIEFEDILASLKVPFLLNDLADYQAGNRTGFRIWLLIYSLTNRLSDESGWFYLSKIAEENVVYPKIIQENLEKYIKPYRSIKEIPGYLKTSNYVRKFEQEQEEKQISGEDIDHYSKLIDLSKNLEIYLPRNLTLDDLDYFFLTSLYWTRYLRTEKNRMQSLLNKINLIDLYLVTANTFERYPARKLLSYYNDIELYEKFGRLGNYYFPKTYDNKIQQLDGLVSLSRYRFGYFTVENWVSPIQLKFHQFKSPFVEYPSKILTLSELRKRLEIVNEKEIDEDFVFRYPNRVNIYSRMPILQLAILIYSNWPALPDQDIWKPFIQLVDKYSNSLHQEYLILHKNPFQLEIDQNPGQKIILTLPKFLKSVEQEYDICLLCSVSRPSKDFGLCGHGVCSTCQEWLKSVKCPFCTEHFVFENISDNFIEQLRNPIFVLSSDLKSRINIVNQNRPNREFKFDWTNTDFRIFN